MKCAYYDTCKDSGAACASCEERSISLSELIVQLRKIEALHGNMPVKVSDRGPDGASVCDGRNNYYTSINVQG